MGGSAGEGAVVTLLQSAQGHIPLLGQCCLVNRSASCLWLLSFLLNINGQIPSSQPPLLPTPTFCLSLPADSSHKDSLLTFLKCLNCKRVFSKPETSSARRKKGEHGQCKLEAPRGTRPGLGTAQFQAPEQAAAPRACPSLQMADGAGLKWGYGLTASSAR